MDLRRFEEFDRECAEKLPGEIDKILEAAKGKEACAIGFITTDDFFGAYLSWDYSRDIDAFSDWGNSFEPDFLYQPLVDIVEASEEIDFCRPSPEKWAFAQALLAVLAKNIQRLPDELFQRNGFRREDILFFASMSDGDYIQEMLDVSIGMFNTSETLAAYGLAQ